MEDMATNLKYAKVLKNGIVDYLKSITREEILTYDDVAKKYNITKENFEKLYKWSREWMRESINKAKRKTDLPEVVKNDLRLAHAKAFGVHQRLNFERPWKIFNTGELISCFTDVIGACGDANDIGLVIVDATSQGTQCEWTTDAFKRLVECIANIISGDSYVLLALVPFGPVLNALDTTLRHIVGSYHLEYGTYTKGDASKKKFSSCHDLVVLKAMISKTEDKKNWHGLIANEEIPSIIYDECEYESEEEEESTSSTTTKTKRKFFDKPITYESCGLSGGCISKFPKDRAFFSMLVSSFCQPGKVVVDAFTGGFAMREALQSGKKSIVFVNNTSEKDLLESYASMMVEMLTEVNAFYKSLDNTKMKTVDETPSTNPINALPEDFVRDINKSKMSLDLFNMQEGYAGFEDITGDDNDDAHNDDGDDAKMDDQDVVEIQHVEKDIVPQDGDDAKMDVQDVVETQHVEKDIVPQAS